MRATSLAVLVAALLTGSAGSAQISPGPLVRPHAELEGSLNCFQCHRVGHGVDAGLCLQCHAPLRQRMRQGEGFHAGGAFMQCETCHIEHHGRDFELIWWGEGGRESFDHAEAGYDLEGAHRELGCRECHRSELVARPQPLLDAGKDLNRTFLGLSTVCADCHEDTHRGQFESVSCDTCHGDTAWSPATGFEHDATAFPLTGAHVEAPCADCHVPEADGFVPFRGVPSSCVDCHEDTHRGRFGNDCASCHSTGSWSDVRTDTFDHRRTGFALRGAHGRTPCEGCHGPGLTRLEIPRFELCATCHADVHLGQFTGRTARADDCAGCHGEQAFRPSTFDRRDHEETRFPLRGRHGELGCETCHGEMPVDELRRIAHITGRPLAPSLGAAEIRTARTFRLPVPPSRPIACVDCHRDPHDLQAASEPSRTCESCHGQSSWTEPIKGPGTFDHADTGWPLLGGHAETACLDCHRPEKDPRIEPGGRRILFTATSTSCTSCHRDPHVGQFGAATATCSECHGFETWQAERFNHDRAAFRLEGAHRGVACVACHHLEEAPAGASDGAPFFVRYKPLAHSCIDCHGESG